MVDFDVMWRYTIENRRELEWLVMTINALLAGLDCSCGRHHTCDIQHVSIGPGAVAHLADWVRENTVILVVADENTYRAAGEQTMAALAGKKVRKVIFSGKTILIPNEEAIECVNAQLQDADLIIGIGSGVIQDLCKYVSHVSGIPYYVVATAPSMDGYASTGAAMILGGMKVTVSAKVPAAIFADTDVLKNAPMDMIQAGYGDIVGKFSALNDWRLSHIVNGEYFCQEIYDLTFEMVHKTLELGQGLIRREEQSVKVLMEALVIVGIAMSFAGSSRPASGSEHHLSHYFEITGIVRGEDYFPHGIDVAYSTVITAALREKLLTQVWPENQYRPDREAYVEEVSRIYGPVAEGCIALQDRVGLYQKDMLSVYQEKKTEIFEILSEMPKANEIQAMLEAVELNMDAFYNLYSEKKIHDALFYAKELKDRYTVLWMYYDLFGGK